MTDRGAGPGFRLEMPSRSAHETGDHEAKREHGRRSGQAVDTIQNTSVAWQEPAAVLEVDVTLEPAHSEVADDGCQGRR